VKALSIGPFRADVLPGGKMARRAELATGGRRTPMVGDGLKDGSDA
jgi:cation transport ATPase